MQEEQQTLHKLRQDQQVISMNQSEHLIKKKNARDHTSNTNHNALVKDQQYRKCIPLRQRIGSWFYNTFTCTNSQASFVQKLDEVQRKHPVNFSQDLKKMIKDKIVKMKIIQTSRLKLDSNVIHPFVKVHIVDKNTGCYIQKKHQQVQPMIYHYESITFHQNRKYDASENNILLPFATNPCDFRKLGNSVCKWNQKFFINFPAERLISPDTIFLFEILDFNHQALLFKDTSTYDKDNFYRIAWGYLRPVGLGRGHIGISKVQLYQYKFNNKKEFNQSKSHIPSVYYDFIWNNHEKYQGFLTVQLIYVNQPRYKQIEEDAECPQNLFEEQVMDPTFLQRIEGDFVQKQLDGTNNANLLKFFRNNGICQVPKELVYKLQSEKLGCFRLIFVGNYLFAACSTRKYTNIKVFQLENGEKVMTMRGHRQIIYSMSHTINQRYLITSGSDFFVRIWQIPSNFTQYIDEDESQSLIRAQIIHTAAVYSTACIHVPLNDKFYITTCCYDGGLRLWQVNLEEKTTSIVNQIYISQEEQLIVKVYPTTCVVSQSNFFIVGDSIGDIRIYDFAHNKLNLRCHIRSQQLLNDEILSIKIINKNNILVQASDNLIRHFELSGNKLKLALKYSGAQFQSQMCNFAVSPDNRFLLSPSQAGKPYMWDLKTGIAIPIDHLNLDIKGKLVNCAWHPKYNLVAFGGFVELCPIMIYGNILTQTQQKMVAAQIL